jgi:transcriptional regulator with XRE-family HTH domain
VLGARFKVLCADAGLSIAETAKALHVTPRTVRNWISGRVGIPYAAYRLVRILGRWELPDPAWAGWIMHSGRLWSPEGHGFVPGDSSWWGLLVRQARMWREQHEREAQLRAVMWRAGWAEPSRRDGVSAAQPGPAAPDQTGPTGVAGRRRSLPAEGQGPNLFKGHFRTTEGGFAPLSLGKPVVLPDAGQGDPFHIVKERGYGGCGPHGDTVQAGQGEVRGHSSTLPGSSSRLDQLPSAALDGKDY